jgi:hypothetical protein
MLNRFVQALKIFPALQNWLIGTIIMLACYSYTAWYFLNAAIVFEWERGKTIGILGVLLGLIVWVSAYRYNKIARDLRQ